MIVVKVLEVLFKLIFLLVGSIDFFFFNDLFFKIGMVKEDFKCINISCGICFFLFDIFLWFCNEFLIDYNYRRYCFVDFKYFIFYKVVLEMKIRVLGVRVIKKEF